MVPGVHHLQYVDKVMKQAILSFLNYVVIF